MSKFEDLSSFLDQQQSLVSEARNSVTNSIQEQRAHAQPLVQGCVETLQDYYETILSPRTDLRIVLKKKEKPNIDTHHPYDPHYVYIVNFIPDDLPYNYDHYDEYANPDKIGFNDWHPNVALQFELRLVDKYSQDARGVVGLKANIQLRVWGIVEAEKRAIMPRDVSFGYANGWYKPYTTFGIDGEIDNPRVAIANLSTVLKIVTPQVLAHKKTIKSR